MYYELDEYRLTQALLEELGCSIDNNQIVIDQDTMKPIRFREKNIKATIDCMKPLYITDLDIKLEPLNRNNLRLLATLFGYILDKEQKNGNIPEVLTFYMEDDTVYIGENAKTVSRIIVKCAGGDNYISDYFTNKCLIYCDIILKIGGSINNQIDLHVFDIC